MSTRTSPYPSSPVQAKPTRSATPFIRTPKGQVLAVFLVLLGIATLAEGVSAAAIAAHLAVASLAACLMDVFYLRVETGHWQVPTSALLTGLIVGMILAPGTSLDIVAVASIISILSKQLLRIGRDHIFNPAVVGLLWVGIQFGSGESWWGALANAPVPWMLVLLVGGTFVISRLNKLLLVLTFGAAYFGLWTAASFIDTQTAVEMFRPPFLQAAIFLAFFMLTDPPTSPNRYTEQVTYGLIAAAGAFVATLLGAGQLYLLPATLAANLWLAMRRQWRRRLTPPVSGRATDARGEGDVPQPFSGASTRGRARQLERSRQVV